MSPDPNNPWLAVGLQPGQMLKPDGIKLVYVYDWNSRKLHHIFDAGIDDELDIIHIYTYSKTVSQCVMYSSCDLPTGDGGLGVGVSTEFSPDGK